LDDRALPILGFDQDAKVLEIAARNAGRAGVADAIAWRPLRWPAAAEAVGTLPAGPGLVLVNPPYGRRLSDQGRAAALIRMVGRELRSHFSGWRAGVLLADPSWVGHLKLPPRETIPLFNGGLRVTYVVLEVP
jgi:putative N6-adenine-specific DNA methylase